METEQEFREFIAYCDSMTKELKQMRNMGPDFIPIKLTFKELYVANEVLDRFVYEISCLHKFEIERPMKDDFVKYVVSKIKKTFKSEMYNISDFKDGKYGKQYI